MFHGMASQAALGQCMKRGGLQPWPCLAQVRRGWDRRKADKPWAGAYTGSSAGRLLRQFVDFGQCMRNIACKTRLLFYEFLVFLMSQTRFTTTRDI